MKLNKQIIFSILLVLSVALLGSCISEKDYLQKSEERDKYFFELADLKVEYDKLTDQKNNLEEAKRKLELANSDQEKTIGQLNQDRAELEKILQAKSDTLSKTIVDLRANIADLRNENSDMNRQITNLKTEISDLNKEIADRNKEITNMKVEMIGLRNEINYLNKENDSLKGKNKALQDQAEALRSQKELEMNQVKGTYENLLQNMKSEIDKGKITITQLEGKLKVNMLDEILFDSGKVTIKPEGIEVLERVGKILLEVKDRSINIEGHTDNVPIGSELTKKYPTNWELSAARATNVARYLQEKAGKYLNPQ